MRSSSSSIPTPVTHTGAALNTPDLPVALQRIRDKIFGHPSTHNLEWRDVHALLEKLGECSTEPNGNLKMNFRGRSYIYPPHHPSEIVTLTDLVRLRHVLTDSNSPAPASLSDGHRVVVIDHHDASVFPSDHEGATPKRILAPPATEHSRHARHEKHFSRGMEKPNPEVFFSDVASNLTGATTILIMGSGKGSASEVQPLVAWLERHFPSLFRKIIGTMIIDQHHITEPQILAAAREFRRQAQPAAEVRSI